jgi:hypothetical protein
VIAFGPAAGSRRLLGIVVLAALVGFGLELWRRQTLREFPVAGEKDEAPAPAAAASP